MALSADEILILGYEYPDREVYLFDTRTDTCSAVTTKGAQQISNKGGYPIALCGPNKVVALVSLPSGEAAFFEYVREANKIA